MRIPLRSFARAPDFESPDEVDAGAELAASYASACYASAGALEGAVRDLTLRASRLRYIRGRLAADLLATRGWSALGFVRLGDYSRERHGVSGRTLEEDARVARSLERLPGMTGEFLAATLSWTQVRLLTLVAKPRDEQRWIAVAKTCDTRTLESQIKIRHPSETQESAADPEDEAAVRFSVRISRSGRRLWRAACEYAERSAGSALRQAQVLELVVAEAASGAPHPSPAPVSMFGSAPARRTHHGSRRFSLAGDTPLHPRIVQPARSPDLGRFLEDVARDEGLSKPFPPQCESMPAGDVRATFHWDDVRDPFVLDARLREVKLAMQRIDADLGRLLKLAVERRLHRASGFASFAEYVDARFEFCLRKAWTLIAVERASLRACAELATAYRSGEISHLAANILLPVMNSRHGSAWIERARLVTLRRLEAEVSWALDRRDAADGAESVAVVAPPPLDHVLETDTPSVIDREQLEARASAEPPVAAQDGMCAAPSAAGASDDEVQMRAARNSAELHFLVPSSVASLAESTMLALRRGSESRGAAFERMVASALFEWTSAPSHRDPVFARDGWRCAVPACRSRRNLHDHHILFRSHGGGNDRDNRVTVCAAHHLHGLHAGRIRAHGRAPSQIVWELGCQGTSREPLARLLGDRYLHREAGAAR